MPQDAVYRNRMLEKLDEYLKFNDYESAKKHLLYWLGEAESAGEEKTVLLIFNELMGLCRKLGEAEEAQNYAHKALEKIKFLGIENNTGAATTYLNSATVFKAFNKADMAMPLFEKAQAIYEKNLSPTDDRLGGLYNNMALALVDLKRYKEAYSFYEKALKVMSGICKKEPEQAITILNMASAAEAELGLEQAEDRIREYIEKAIELLDSCKDRTDGNYAFVCEKCASVFGYYGYFYYENQLNERIRSIRENIQ